MTVPVESFNLLPVFHVLAAFERANYMKVL